MAFCHVLLPETVFAKSEYRQYSLYLQSRFTKSVNSELTASVILTIHNKGIQVAQNIKYI